jgi:hypothetical protein
MPLAEDPRGEPSVFTRTAEVDWKGRRTAWNLRKADLFSRRAGTVARGLPGCVEPNLLAQYQTPYAGPGGLKGSAHARITLASGLGRFFSCKARGIILSSADLYGLEVSC